MSTIVIGGGWSGLAAAVTLAANDIPVTLIESAKQLGGRARCAPFGDDTVDNGQHILIGAYRQTLSLLELIGVDVDTALQRQSLSLDLRSPKGNNLHLKTPELPAPLHLLFGLMTAQGLSLQERALALKFCTHLAFTRFRLDEDVSLHALLIRHRQNGRLTKMLWEPLCLATLNTPITKASAQLFLKVLHDTFNYQRQHSDLIIPKISLGKLFPEPAMEFIESRGGLVMLKTRAIGLRVDNGRISGVHTEGETIPCNHLILATSPLGTKRLLDDLPPMASICHRLAQFEYEPITTIYLRYPKTVKLSSPMIGLVDTHSQWLFDRSFAGQPGLIAVIISASSELITQGKDAIIKTVVAEIAALYPDWPAPLDVQLITEKRATFVSSVNIDKTRPVNKTLLPGCWLAGDFTDTGYPATLEGAVISGQRAAQGVRQEILRGLRE
ncbi:MAG: hydroxysqualene dehydroxylase HpnE [Gammaproteobacteria bacterium]|nr:hydroxysqualene dehydroxylase HpnE [Gammaproteobacteria bacterium]